MCEMEVTCTPSFHVEEWQMPEISGCEVGEKYKFTIEVEMKSKNEYKGDEINTNGSFSILAYKMEKKKTVEEMSDEEFAKYQSKSLAKGKLE